MRPAQSSLSHATPLQCFCPEKRVDQWTAEPFVGTISRACGRDVGPCVSGLCSSWASSSHCGRCLAAFWGSCSPLRTLKGGADRHPSRALFPHSPPRAGPISPLRRLGRPLPLTTLGLALRPDLAPGLVPHSAADGPLCLCIRGSLNQHSQVHLSRFHSTGGTSHPSEQKPGCHSVLLVPCLSLQHHRVLLILSP